MSMFPSRSRIVSEAETVHEQRDRLLSMESRGRGYSMQSMQSMQSDVEEVRLEGRIVAFLAQFFPGLTSLSEQQQVLVAWGAMGCGALVALVVFVVLVQAVIHRVEPAAAPETSSFMTPTAAPYPQGSAGGQLPPYAAQNPATVQPVAPVPSAPAVPAAPAMPAAPVAPVAPAQPAAQGTPAAAIVLPPGAQQVVQPQPSMQLDNCICLFDVDRTITGRQGAVPRCPGNHPVQGVQDVAFGLQAAGPLVLSQLAQGMGSTFCNRCHRGVVTAGGAGGPNSKERAAVLHALGGPAATFGGIWSEPGAPETVHSALVTGAADTKKQEWVRKIVLWIRNQKGVPIPDDQVYFFDDRDGNVPPFAGTGFNAHQVSCSTRDNIVGLCGATVAEVMEEKGVRDCHKAYR